MSKVRLGQEGGPIVYCTVCLGVGNGQGSMVRLKKVYRSM